MISNDEHDYDYVIVHPLEGPTQAISSIRYSKMVGDCHPAETVDARDGNEAFDVSKKRPASIETSQNIAYHRALDML